MASSSTSTSGRASALFVTNQSAGRVHPCPPWHASARFDLRVAAARSSACCPARRSRSPGRAIIRGPRSTWAGRAGWSGATSSCPGRTHYARGPERFAFDRIVQELRGPSAKGRSSSTSGSPGGALGRPRGIPWHFGDGRGRRQPVHLRRLSPPDRPDLPDGEIAIQATAAGDTCIRLLGRDAEAPDRATARLALAAAARLAGDPGPGSSIRIAWSRITGSPRPRGPDRVQPPPDRQNTSFGMESEP